VKINLNTPINTLGYGVVGYNIWRSLREISDVTFYPIGNQNIQFPSQSADVEKFREDHDKALNFQHTSPTLKIFHENKLEERIGKGKFVAWPFFEVSKFNSLRKSHVESVDHLIVSSEWAKNIVIDQTNLMAQDISVIECGVDRNIFNEQSASVNTDSCVFFNCGKWEIRKGHDILHKAFKDAFQNNESVELWMMNQNPFLNQDQHSLFSQPYENDDRIRFVPRVQYHEELAGIMNNVFCGVFPARAEGWNLEALELFSCGKNVVITDYSAHTQFCNKDNSFLINIESEEPMYDGHWFTGDNGVWASLDGSAYDSIVENLRDVYKLWKENPAHVNHAGIETAKTLSWEEAANKILQVMEQ
jgi:glycosyltransferase involved in cell wall biosynthesis